MRDYKMSQPITKTLALSENSFDEFIAQSPIALIEFWAEWCGPCKMVAPLLEELAESYSGKVWIGKVDTDHEQKLAMKYGAQSIPTFWAFKEGVPVGRFVGAQSKMAFEDIFKQLFNLDMDTVREQMKK
jgi:thioredoxin 1